MSTYVDILTETRDRVGLITIHRPDRLNALRSALMLELADAASGFDHDDNVGAIVITGSERAFSAGADITEMADATIVSMMERDMIAGWHKLEDVRKPLIAAVSGYCFGGGCELALACDMIVASETAQFGQPEINIGIMPGAGGTQRLARTVGKSMAMEMVLNDRRLSAEEALRVGIASQVHPVDGYLDAALALAASIAGRAPLAVRLAKEAVHYAYESGMSEGLAYEERLFYTLFATADQKEGMAAFVEKRKPNWQGK